MIWTSTSTLDYMTKIKIMKHEILSGTISSVVHDLKKLEDTWDIEIMSSVLGTSDFKKEVYVVIVKILRPKM
tara:strand:- start:9055 stop:9270 length:216 start_codon:yes stop_codon:yes gene_type:complete